MERFVPAERDIYSFVSKNNAALPGEKFASILLVGTEGAGKTNLILRMMGEDFVEKHFPTEDHQSIQFKTKINGQKVHIDFFDTYGVGDYSNQSLNIFDGKSAIVVVYDISKQGSLETLRKETKYLRRWLGYGKDEEQVILLVGNKTDLQRQINEEDAKDFAKKCEMEYIETSAKTGDNVQNLFDMITANYSSFPVISSSTATEDVEKIHNSKCCSVS